MDQTIKKDRAWADLGTSPTTREFFSRSSTGESSSRRDTLQMSKTNNTIPIFADIDMKVKIHGREGKSNGIPKQDPFMNKFFPDCRI